MCLIVVYTILKIQDDDTTVDINALKAPFLYRNLMTRKLKTEIEYNFFWSKKPDSIFFYVNEGLKAILASDDLKLLYVAGNSDFLIRKGAPCASKVGSFTRKFYQNIFLIFSQGI